MNGRMEGCAGNAGINRRTRLPHNLLQTRHVVAPVLNEVFDAGLVIVFNNASVWVEFIRRSAGGEGRPGQVAVPIVVYVSEISIVCVYVHEGPLNAVMVRAGHLLQSCASYKSLVQ